LETISKLTWVYKKDKVRVNWLQDEEMLPKVVPTARIYTYDWDADYYRGSADQTLKDHANMLLLFLEEALIKEIKPTIFIASCFGGLLLAKV
jgi:hypothetical protein